MIKKFKLKKDKNLSARGGSSAFYDIYCSHCRSWLLLYQKDGPGNLFRLYFNRIHSPENIACLANQSKKISDFKNLVCSKCGCLIGVHMIYKPENRYAFRLVPGNSVKKKCHGTFLNRIFI